MKTVKFNNKYGNFNPLNNLYNSKPMNNSSLLDNIMLCLLGTAGGFWHFFHTIETIQWAKYFETGVAAAVTVSFSLLTKQLFIWIKRGFRYISKYFKS